MVHFLEDGATRIKHFLRLSHHVHEVYDKKFAIKLTHLLEAKLIFELDGVVGFVVR